MDKYLIAVDKVTHEAFHAGKSALGSKAGWWDHTLMAMIKDRVLLKPGKLTREEMLQIGKEMLGLFQLPNIFK